ncbi:MAG TPA: hypothetical protein VHL77_10790, partial [Ferruginibacter sp.]|nr:hypothetical protein [Ferruginibacter sp.]
MKKFITLMNAVFANNTKRLPVININNDLTPALPGSSSVKGQPGLPALLKWRAGLKTGLLVLGLLIMQLGFVQNAKADCTIGNVNASSFFATYPTCTGVMTIPNGVSLTLDADLTIP